MLALPSQTPNLIEQHGISRAEADCVVWVVDRDRRKWSGAAAINRIWEELGGGWAWLARLYRFAPARRLEDWLYRWIAAHRAALSRWWGAEPEWKA